ncbi:hypothetical protein VNO77_16344 [Canavalia gladiata]|uniref:Uncharacterized protein n=1 Tax=Canavalia gladiata TaxID=3824 RepID=A0AAN9M5C5_CANGL
MSQIVFKFEIEPQVPVCVTFLNVLCLASPFRFIGEGHWALAQVNLPRPSGFAFRLWNIFTIAQNVIKHVGKKMDLIEVMTLFNAFTMLGPLPLWKGSKVKFDELFMIMFSIRMWQVFCKLKNRLKKALGDLPKENSTIQL